MPDIKDTIKTSSTIETTDVPFFERPNFGEIELKDDITHQRCPACGPALEEEGGVPREGAPIDGDNGDVFPPPLGLKPDVARQLQEQDAQIGRDDDRAAMFPPPLGLKPDVARQLLRAESASPIGASGGQPMAVFPPPLGGKFPELAADKEDAAEKPMAVFPPPLGGKVDVTITERGGANDDAAVDAFPPPLGLKPDTVEALQEATPEPAGDVQVRRIGKFGGLGARIGTSLKQTFNATSEAFKSATGQLNAANMIHDQHEELVSLVKRAYTGKSFDVNTRQAMLKRLCDFLVAHLHVKEELFYPAIVEASLWSEENMLIAKQQHEQATQLVTELLSTGAADEATLDDKLGKLAIVLRDHIRLLDHAVYPAYPEVTDKISEKDLKELGTKMHKRFRKLMGEKHTREMAFEDVGMPVPTTEGSPSE